MILSGSKRSATSRAKRRMSLRGTSAPRYQRGKGVAPVLACLCFMSRLYSVAARFPALCFPLTVHDKSVAFAFPSC
jgi:hypothetical protein